MQRKTQKSLSSANSSNKKYQGIVKMQLVDINPSENDEYPGLRHPLSGFSPSNPKLYTVQLVWKITKENNPNLEEDEIYVNQPLTLDLDQEIPDITNGAWFMNKRGQLTYVRNTKQFNDIQQFLAYAENISNEAEANAPQKDFVNDGVYMIPYKALNLYNAFSRAVNMDPTDEDNEFSLDFVGHINDPKKLGNALKDLRSFIQSEDLTCFGYLYVASSQTGAVYMEIDGRQTLTTMTNVNSSRYQNSLENYFKNQVKGGRTPFSKSFKNLPIELTVFVKDDSNDAVKEEDDDDLPF